MLSWFRAKNTKSNHGYKSLRQLLKEHPNSGQTVIGDGTVHVDPEKIRTSASYKEMTRRIENYVKRNGL